MKILFYIGGLGKGGAERVITNLANYFAQSDNDVTIMTDFNREAKYPLDKRVKIYALDKDDKIKLFKLSNNILRLKNICKYVKEYNPNVIVSFLINPSYRMLILKNRLHVPIIVSVRNDPNQEYNSLIKKKLAYIMYSKADGIVFQTKEAQNWFPKNIIDNSTVIANPINDTFICEPYIGKRKNVIVTVGRLSKQKNHKLLIDTFDDISKKYQDYILKIYGDGELMDELKQQIKCLGLDKKVFLMGVTDNVKNEIYKAKMFVLTSNYEGMPNVLMEAMALGIPCISTDCEIGGPRFLIKNNVNGLLVRVNDKKELFDAIETLIKDEKVANKLGNNAHKICETLSPKIINNKWEKYIKLISN